MLNIRFVRGNDFISDGILLGERDGDQPTHVEVVLPDGRLLGAHAVGGVEIREPGYDKTTTIHELVVPINFGYDMTPAQIMAHQKGWDVYEKEFYDFLHAQVGKPYDFSGVAGLALGRSWRDDDKWFCSELVGRALEVCEFFEDLSSENNHISPRDLLVIMSSRLKIVWARPRSPAPVVAVAAA